tara:strand:+ start:404 stop:733 length:330 start_codon:yes stop_codon:yes gene_type:complete
MRTALFISIACIFFSCSKHENRLEGSWFVNYFVNDSKIEDFTLKLNEGGSGEKDGSTEVTWSVNKRDLTLIINANAQKWENNRNKRNIQFYLSSDSLGNYLRMEMERIK